MGCIVLVILKQAFMGVLMVNASECVSRDNYLWISYRAEYDPEIWSSRPNNTHDVMKELADLKCEYQRTVDTFGEKLETMAAELNDTNKNMARLLSIYGVEPLVRSGNSNRRLSYG